ncbi:copper chaperone [Candidatus Woesearchaeota archaeon]|nr:MAG: copper chaperone [Candidatus Woesearchaeota archaeon]
MKKKILLAALITLLFGALSACTAPVQDKTELPANIQTYNEQMSSKKISKEAILSGKVRKATFDIKDMSCPSCALGVEYQWRKLDGVYDAKIDYPQGTGFAIYDSTKLDAEKIAQASQVYKATVREDEQLTEHT